MAVLVRLDYLAILHPDVSAVVDAPLGWKRFESWDVLEDGEDHLIELRVCQSRSKLLQYHRGKYRQLLVGECVS